MWSCVSPIRRATTRTPFAPFRSIPRTAGSLPLSQLATVQEAKGPNQINREGVQRRIYIAANVTGRDLVGAVQELQRKIAEKMQLPPGLLRHLRRTI